MILACSTMMVSCDSWLEVKPYDKISEGELQKSEEGYQKMLNGIYIDLNSDALYGQSLSVEMIEVMGGAYAIGTDNSVWGNYKDLSNYQYGTEYWRNRLDQTWNKAYALILNCNKILEYRPEPRSLYRRQLLCRKGRSTGAESDAALRHAAPLRSGLCQGQR